MIANKTHPDQRLRSLDGLRGIAILLVIGYHYFYVFAIPEHQALYPYGDFFRNIWIFQYGNMGVELFFIISGFVIAMTLESCRTLGEFALRRFTRLWPPLLFCSLLTFLVVRLSHTPFSLSSHQIWQNFLPSLTLTPPTIWTWASADVRFVDFVYWSLEVEVKFYIVAGVLYFFAGTTKLSRNLVIFTCIDVLARAVVKRLLPGTEELFYWFLIPDYMPWLTAGAIYYNLYRYRFSPVHSAILLATMLALISRDGKFAEGKSTLSVFVVSCTFFAIFWLIARRHRVTRILCTPALIWVGACSYSVYLLHFEIGMTAISAIPGRAPFALQVSAVLAIVLLILLGGHLSFKFIELRGKSFVNGLIGLARSSFAS